MGEDAARQIVDNLNLITHIHVAESPARNLPVMDGTIQYRKILKAVREAGYDGFWGLEFVPGNDVMKELEDAFRRFAE
jgi:hydroxypyruvate isomerase